MAFIEFSNYIGGFYVDDEDYAEVSKYKWAASIKGLRVMSIRAWVENNTRSVSIGSFLLNPESGKIVDHRDRDATNCRRANLRVCTNAQNMANTRAKGGTSSFKGVSFYQPTGKWRARAYHNGVSISKHFTSEVDAAKWYNQQATKFFGEFAVLNQFN
jgi:hypothetical protein